MHRLTRCLAALVCLAPLAALAEQVANFDVPEAAAESHACGSACRARLALTIPADRDAVGRDFDVDFYATAANFSRALSQPGDVLKLEPVDPKTLTLDGCATTYRLQYVSVDADGSVVPVTGFIAFPLTPHIPAAGGDGEAPLKYRLAAFAHGTGSWQPVLRRGYAVVATDYAGLGNNYTDHKYLFLPAHASDVHYAVAAARRLFGARLTDEWVSFGHSQGGGAAWKLAESEYVRNDTGYLGTVAIAPATYAADQIYAAAVDGLSGGGGNSSSSRSKSGAGVGFLPLIPTAVQRVIPSYNESILAPTLRSRVAMAEEAQLCLEGVLGLTLDLGLADVVSVAGALRDRPTLGRWQDMAAPAQGSVSPAPILVVQGQNDTAVRWQTTEEAWARACAAGNEVHLRLFPTQGHRPSLAAGAPEWLAWMDGLFDEQRMKAAGGGGGACKAREKKKCTRYVREPFDAEYVRAPTDVDLKPYLGPLNKTIVD
ncbi:hypothetical protein ARSEF4850_000753 [Beauveria asiatica]